MTALICLLIVAVRVSLFSDRDDDATIHGYCFYERREIPLPCIDPLNEPIDRGRDESRNT